MIKIFNIKTFFFFFIFTFILFFFGTESSPLYELNYWSDVNIYYTIGKSIWHGKVIYRDLFDHKGPLIFFIYATATTFSDRSFLGLFFLQVLFHTVTLYFVYLSIKIFLEKNISILLSLFFSIFFLKFSSYGGSAEEFMLPFLVISMYYLLLFYTKKEEIHPPKYMAIHGFCTAAVFFIKLNIIVFWFFPLLFIFGFLLVKKHFKNLFDNALSFFIGILIVLIPVVLYFIINHAFFDFINSYIKFNFTYSLLGSKHADSSTSTISFLWKQLIFLYRWNYIIFSIIIFGILFFTLINSKISKLGKISILTCFLTLLSTVLYSRYLLEYYIIVLQCYSTLGLITIGIFIRKFYKKQYNQKIILPISILFIFSCSIYLKSFFEYSPKTLLNRDFKSTFSDDFTGKILMEEKPSLLLCGLGEGLFLFTKTGIVPNIKYFFFPNITNENYPIIKDSQIGYIDRTETDYVFISNAFRYYDSYINHIDKNYVCIATYEKRKGFIFYLYKRKNLILKQ